LQIKDEDEQVDDQCRVKQYIAPGVERKPTMYSPIKADRWSCRRVLLYLLDELWKGDDSVNSMARDFDGA